MIRALIVLLGALASLWSWGGLNHAWMSWPARELATRILHDERFRPEILGSVLVQISSHPASDWAHAEFVRAEAVLLWRQSNEQITLPRSEDLDRTGLLAKQKLVESLTYSPSDPLLWLFLYSVTNTIEGFDKRSLNYLGFSYRLGPFEGAVALRRERSAFTVFSLLDAATQERIMAEFSGLVASNFIEDAAANLVSVGLANKESLLAALSNVDLLRREMLSKRLSSDGIKAIVPGVEIDERPWR